MATSDNDLVFPRLLYRGEPDVLGTGQIGETKRVEDRQAYDEAKKDGWRLDRVDAKHQPRQAPGTLRVPAQTIKAGSSATDLVHQNAQAAAAAGGPPVPAEGHPATDAERDAAVRQAEADANAADPTGAQRAGAKATREAEAASRRGAGSRKRKRDAGERPLAAPRRNATKK